MGRHVYIRFSLGNALLFLVPFQCQHIQNFYLFKVRLSMGENPSVPLCEGRHQFTTKIELVKTNDL